MRILVNLTKTMALAALAASIPAIVHAADYTAQSPANRVALVELYSSEGCNSCPPADQWLSKVGAQAKANRIVPLALHVDYWDNLGWKDRFGDHRFTVRQQELAAFANSRVVYTPEIFVGGKELRRWSSDGAFDGAISKITAQPAPADISIKLASTAVRTFDLTSNVKLRQDSKDSHNAYVALYENKLVSKVSAGENGGVTLHHDYVVRRWLGPFALKNGVAQIREKIALDSIAPDIRADRFGIVTFVQNAVSGEVLQVANLVVDR
ncbi:hypothetical protein CAter282_1579 [Collimonas arenae]|uniref:Secreted protein n=1 Tax=Collimonas arenae TaxID=279058 RepID=A0A127PNY6_9BURK|nr:DUF1223 domain-containing protein [Collimonas arenae]AMO99463.1 hypothetical protein CAter10_1706 [Collimonas arenae]AMP09365.1 hypothetical protein CAter282_1579 [Collimonas arenae]